MALRHHYRLLNWEKTLTGEVVVTVWQCIHCKDTKLHVTPQDWAGECSGLDDEMIERLAEEAEKGHGAEDLKER